MIFNLFSKKMKNELSVNNYDQGF